jgi:hypothetical protein
LQTLLQTLLHTLLQALLQSLLQTLLQTLLLLRETQLVVVYAARVDLVPGRCRNCAMAHVFGSMRGRGTGGVLSTMIPSCCNEI